MLSIVVPCYNEEETVDLFYRAVEDIKALLQMEIEYIFVDDGSNDKTMDKLRALHQEDPAVHYISFSRNFGKEAALYAGLEASRGDFVTVMDADLQDPPELLPQMMERLQENPDLDCIGTKRHTRTGEPIVRSFFAKRFYSLINRISDTEIVDGARDFRLMRRQMVDAIIQVSENNRFSKGIFAWVGFNTEYISYENRQRIAGETSWSFWKLFNYSIDGIVNFSDAPLNLASFVGAISCVFASIALVFIVVRTLIFGDPTSGWPSTISIILFIGGIQLLSLGILGKYIGKIFMETKKRPIYITKERDKDLNL